MKVVFLRTRKDAEELEAKCLADARAAGQVCERWANIIESKEGFGVPVKERLKVPEKSLSVDWEPEDDGVLPVR